jgi:single-strand DNA-binding protein
MHFVGRLTKDASIATLKDERKVVNFTVAINDYYKPKGKEKGISVATFVNCSYWINTTIVDRLKKGTLVEIDGRLSVNAYLGIDNEAKASINCHANALKIHQAAKQASDVPADITEPMDDLPF